MIDIACGELISHNEFVTAMRSLIEFSLLLAV
jgi:hypothetical protein